MGFSDGLNPTKDAKKFINNIWLKTPQTLKLLICVIILVLVATLFLPGKINDTLELKDRLIKKTTSESSEKNVRPEINDQEPNDKIVDEQSVKKDNKQNCYTDGEWVPFTLEYWEGLFSRFQVVNGVYTLPDPQKNVDSVAYFKEPCRGSFKTEFVFTPQSETLINLDLFYGSWFRWEIGGNDLNSVKLYKNEEGCTAIKKARLVDTKSKYLKEKIKIGKPVTVIFSTYLTESGKLRTEVDLEEFTSAKTGATTSAKGIFYHEFDVGWKCDANTVLDIENDYERIGIGVNAF